MENPYAAGELTPELAEEERRRPKVWRGVFWAYAVHHAFCVMGMLTGLLIKPSQWRGFCPPDHPLDALINLAAIPMIDLYFVMEPLFFARTATFWHWLRIPLVLTIPLAGFFTRNLAIAIGCGIWLSFRSAFLRRLCSGHRSIRRRRAGDPCSQHHQPQLQPFAAEALVEFALLVFARALDDDLEQLGRPALARRLARRSWFGSGIVGHGGCHGWLGQQCLWASRR